MKTKFWFEFLLLYILQRHNLRNRNNDIIVEVPLVVDGQSNGTRQSVSTMGPSPTLATCGVTALYCGRCTRTASNLMVARQA